MVFCGSCAVPSCASIPSIGFGPGGLAGVGSGRLGGFGYKGFGFGAGGMGGSAVSASTLGILDGVIPSCINQILSAEMVVKPPFCILTIPGAILSANCEPVTVGGNTPCALGGAGEGYLGNGHRFKFVGDRGSICYSPC